MLLQKSIQELQHRRGQARQLGAVDVNPALSLPLANHGSDIADAQPQRLQLKLEMGEGMAE